MQLKSIKSKVNKKNRRQAHCWCCTLTYFRLCCVVLCRIGQQVKIWTGMFTKTNEGITSAIVLNADRSIYINIHIKINFKKNT